VKGAGEGAAGFLEAPVSGSKGPAIAGQLIFLASGDAALSASAAVSKGTQVMVKGPASINTYTPRLAAAAAISSP
jgi:3-hydroxyisobutyrate dehydrogenase-like beta-hydroxyacid dehydrogenase